MGPVAYKNCSDLQEEGEEEMDQDGDTTATAADETPESSSASSSEPEIVTAPVIPVDSETVEKKTPRARIRTYYTRASSKNIPSISTPLSSSPSAVPVSPPRSHQDNDTTPTTSSTGSLSHTQKKRLNSMPPNDLSSTEPVVTTTAAAAVTNLEPTSSSEPESSTTVPVTPVDSDPAPNLNEHENIMEDSPHVRTYNTRASSKNKNISTISTPFSSSSSAESVVPSTSRYNGGTTGTPTTSSTDSLSSAGKRRASRRTELRNIPSSPSKSKHPRQKGNFSSAVPYFPMYSKLKNKTQKEHAVDETKVSQGFYCLCELSFLNKYRLAWHIRYFNGEAKFQCEKCPLRFVFFSLLKQHMSDCHKIKVAQNKVGCGDCGTVLENREEWKAHRQTMHFKDCGVSQDHSPDASDDSGLKCICGKYFPTKKKLSTHIIFFRYIQKKKPRLRADNTRPASLTPTQIQRAESDSSDPVAAAVRAKRRERRLKLKTTPSSTHPRQIGNNSSAIPYVPKHSKIKNWTPKEHAIDETKLEEGFYCVCEKTFANEFYLKQHVKYFNGDPKFQCEECPLRFLSLCFLKSHMLTCHKIKMAGNTVGCGECGAICKDQEDWKAHRLASHIKDSGAGLRHAPDESEDSGWKCLCGKYFSTKMNMDSHIRNYMNPHDFKCAHCVRTFKSVNRVQSHSRNVHKKLSFPKGTIGCGICGELFTVRKQHVQHMEKEHGVFHTPSAEKAALPPREHAPQEMSPETKKKSPHRFLHRCVCGNAFVNEKLLKQHIRDKIHRAIFKCPHCPVEYRLNARLVKHIAKHHDKEESKTYGCKKCGETFPKQVDLRRHQDTIHGRPPPSRKFNNLKKSKSQVGAEVTPDIE